MVNVFYPLNNQFLTGHNDACITNYWANWDLCNMASVLAIGILCDDGRQVRPGRQLLQDRRGQRLHPARRPVPVRRTSTATTSASGRSPAATRATP